VSRRRRGGGGWGGRGEPHLLLKMHEAIANSRGKTKAQEGVEKEEEEGLHLRLETRSTHANVCKRGGGALCASRMRGFNCSVPSGRQEQRRAVGNRRSVVRGRGCGGCGGEFQQSIVSRAARCLLGRAFSCSFPSLLNLDFSCSSQRGGGGGGGALFANRNTQACAKNVAM